MTWRVVTIVSCGVCRKSRKKDKESPVSTPDDGKQYLDDSLIHEKVIDLDFTKIVDRPPGVDKNEWLATHSTLTLHYT